MAHVPLLDVLQFDQRHGAFRLVSESGLDVCRTDVRRRAAIAL
jgi:hypothetical protein